MNHESDLPQPFVEEEQMAAGDAGYVETSSNLVREEVPPRSVPSADLGGAVASLHQMMEGNCKLMEENRQVAVENRQMMEENRQSLEGCLDGFGQNHQQVEHFLTNFKNARNRRFVNLTEREFVSWPKGV
ncbi:hypothetical protein LINGRAHAP2_LOCUS30299 [Linum grandiflorum]